jgi:hypothetical protein
VQRRALGQKFQMTVVAMIRMVYGSCRSVRSVSRKYALRLHLKSKPMRPFNLPCRFYQLHQVQLVSSCCCFLFTKNRASEQLHNTPPRKRPHLHLCTPAHMHQRITSYDSVLSTSSSTSVTSCSTSTAVPDPSADTHTHTLCLVFYSEYARVSNQPAQSTSQPTDQPANQPTDQPTTKRAIIYFGWSRYQYAQRVTSKHPHQEIPRPA